MDLKDQKNSWLEWLKNPTTYLFEMINLLKLHFGGKKKICIWLIILQSFLAVPEGFL